MDLNALSPYIRVALDNVIVPTWKVKERDLFDYELLYIKEGEAIITVLDQVYNGQPGDIFLFKPRQRHSIAVKGSIPLRQPHIHFDLFYRPDSPEVKVSFKPIEEMSPQEHAWFREDDCSVPPFDLPNHFRLRNPLVFEKLLLDLIREFNMGLPFSQASVKGLFIQLWIFLLREHHWKQNSHIHSNWEQLTKVKQFLNHHFNEEVNVDKLAEMANLSNNHFIRLFKKAFGSSPIKYHQMVRIEKAKEMIQFTSIPLTEIAEEVGFQSIHAFSRAFKQLEGVPPSFYRSQKQ